MTGRPGGAIGRPGAASRRLRRVLVVLAAPGALAVACLFPTSHDYLADHPREPLVVVSTTPGYGEEGVSRTPVLRFTFDQRVRPDSVGADTLSLTAGPSVVRCRRRVDPIDCAVEIRPQDPLRADLTYRAVARDLESMAGGAQEAPVELVFVTGDASSAEPAAPAPTLETLVTEVFVPHCGACHSGFDAAAGLDLTTAAAARAGLVAVQSPYQPGAVRVVPGSSATSYLLWKLLDLPGIWGSAMPPPESPGWPEDRGCGTSDPDLRRIAAWVDSLSSDDATP